MAERQVLLSMAHVYDQSKEVMEYWEKRKSRMEGRQAARLVETQ